MNRAEFNEWINKISESIDKAFKTTPATPLTKLEPFEGSGLYAIYYIGKHKPVLAYATTARRNRNGRWDEPIYVGIGKPSGKSKAWRANDHKISHATYTALRLHARNITLAVEHMALDLRDFYYKFIPVDPLNAEIGEKVMLDRHAPIWNSVVKGFANHHVGSTRLGQRRTRWDVLHMGRPWAAQCQWTEEGTEQIIKALNSHYLHRANVRKMMKKEMKKAEAATLRLVA